MCGPGMGILRNLFTLRFIRTLSRLAAILLAYAAVFLFYSRIRATAFFPTPPLPLLRAQDFFPLEIHQVDVGFFLQVTILPVLLLFVMSFIPAFRRQVQDQTAPHATLGAFLALAALQIITQVYEIWVSQSMHQAFFIGTFVIFIGCLLGGWRTGLLLGVISLVFQSTFELATTRPALEMIRNLGVLEFLRRGEGLRLFFGSVVNPHFSSGVWTAVFANLAADRLGPRRYSPTVTAILGAVLAYAVGDLRFISGVTPNLAVVPAQALITGLGTVWVMLMIRTTQVEASQTKAAEAELARTRAELLALRAQINPHFFFNALNTIRYMIRENPQTARDLLIDLSEVFQRTLRSGEFVPLRDELGYVKAYLSLEQARLGDRLRVAWEGILQPEDPLMSGSAFLDLPVPTLTLQPIVENAVIHGIAKKKEGGAVSIAVFRQKNDLTITVRDDGMGMDPAQLADLLGPEAGRNSGIGVRNVDSRLRMLYGKEYGLAIESEPEKGTRVSIRIPIAETEKETKKSR
jgi:LytS/YehU family sensor histidine kinase